MSSATESKGQKPSEVRSQARREQKQSGRGRRAELMLDKQAKERARQAVLEDQQAELGKRVSNLEARLEAHERRLGELENARNNTPNP